MDDALPHCWNEQPISLKLLPHSSHIIPLERHTGWTNKKNNMPEYVLIVHYSTISRNPKEIECSSPQNPVPHSLPTLSPNCLGFEGLRFEASGLDNIVF